MTAVATIALADAQGTPVTHNFVPQGQDQAGVWWFVDQTGTDSIGWNKISVSLRLAQMPAAGKSSDNSRSHKVLMKIFTPKLETLGTNDAGYTPPPTVSHILWASLEFHIPERSDLQSRKDIRKYMDNLVANSQIVDVVENLLSMY